MSFYYSLSNVLQHIDFIDAKIEIISLTYANCRIIFASTNLFVTIY